MRITGYESENGKVTAITVTDETRGFYDKRFEEERPQGEWSETDNRWGVGAWECSACKMYTIQRFAFCPHCGASMVKEGEAE